MTGCVGCVGFGQNLTPRRDIKAGDVLVMTEGSGGGSIATTALYNSFSEVVKETINLRVISLGQKLIETPLVKNIHALTDITNGGIRGDAFELAKMAGVSITLFEREFHKLINPKVLNMLTKLKIDPLGISIDALLLILPENNVDELLKFVHKSGLSAGIIGCVEENSKDAQKIEEEAKYKSEKGLYQDPKITSGQLIEESNVSLIKTDPNQPSNSKDPLAGSRIIKLIPRYREEPYTPIKKIVDVEPNNSNIIQTAIEDAVKTSQQKKEQLKAWMESKGRV